MHVESLAECLAQTPFGPSAPLAVLVTESSSGSLPPPSWERSQRHRPGQFEAFCAAGLVPGWNLLVQGHSDSGEDKFEINFLSEKGDIVFHIKPRFSSATMVGNAFQGGRWGQEEVSSVFPLVLGEPFEMEVSSDAEHFHVHAQEHKVLQFAHRHRPLAAITRVQVLSDHRLAQVELARRSLSWGEGGY
ncbi:PREDICTED: grifin [Ceratotherium simum simum]|uniref:Galectin n=1 Tax=Ceratotherium simum simum TaxID=73337 RepID=A0ABM1DH14_CERSS|nr:PREDICTED: grifin [Ceratotherium simum simum]